MATLESRITELERQHGGDGVKLVLRADDETDNEARKRAGLVDWPGQVIFMNSIDAML